MHISVLPGASYGQWRMPWAPAEREDSSQVIDWIAQQKWSNGQVGPARHDPRQSCDPCGAALLLEASLRSQML